MEGIWTLFPQTKPAGGKDGGGSGLAKLDDYANTCMAEYVWLDARGVCRSKTKTCTHQPKSPADLGMWNFDGSSTGQSPGEDSDVYLVPVAIFKDPFRGDPHVLVLSECVTGEGVAAKGNGRAFCKEMCEKYADMDPWFGIEQEYTLMKKTKHGLASTTPYGFNDDGSEPAPQGPYYCGAGTGMAIGREIVEKHYAACVYAGVKIAGINAEVMPGQWEYQVGPCRGVSMGDHLTMSRYIMLRVSETCGMQVSFDPKPREGDWNGAGCHTNFSTKQMRAPGGIEAINATCEAFGKRVKEHIEAYGEGNEKRLTGGHETCSINEFKYGTANRAASIRIPRETAAKGCGYMEDRRPAANMDPYKVTGIMMETCGMALSG